MEFKNKKVFGFETDDCRCLALDIENSRLISLDSSPDSIESLEKHLSETPRTVSGPPDYMRAQLCVTHLCNFDCIYCDLDGETVYGADTKMSLETGKKAIDTILSYKPKNAKKIVISLTSNGETLTNWDMVKKLMDHTDRISEGKDYRFTYNFATNATLLTEEMIDDILSHDNLSMFFSLDGTKDVHNKLRKHRGSLNDTYDDVVEKLELYKSKIEGTGRGFSSSSVLTSFNLDFGKIYEHLVDFGFDYIVTRPVRGPGEWGFALSDENVEDFKGAYSKFYDFLIDKIEEGDTRHIDAMAPVYDFFGRPFYMLLLEEKKYHGCPHCPPDTKDLKPYSITFDSNGDIISPCRDLIGVEEFKVGNTSSGIDLKKLERITTHYNEKKEDCVDCWDKYLCGGGCFLQSHYATGNIDVPDPVVCDLTKHVTKLAMRLVDYLQNNQPELCEKLIERGKSASPWSSKYRPVTEETAQP